MCPKLIVKAAEQSTLDIFNINLKHIRDFVLMILNFEKKIFLEASQFFAVSNPCQANITLIFGAQAGIG